MEYLQYFFRIEKTMNITGRSKIGKYFSILLYSQTIMHIVAVVKIRGNCESHAPVIK